MLESGSRRGRRRRRRERRRDSGAWEAIGQEQVVREEVDVLPAVRF